MCEHHWVFDAIEGVEGSTGRMLRMHCDKCAELRSLITPATDEQIAAEFAAQ